jgi:DNA-binding FadR family transcriptional regulator
LTALVARGREVLDDAAEFTRVGVQFHQAIADASANRALRASLSALRGMQLEQLTPLTTHAVAERVSEIHASLVESIAARDPIQARRRSGRHRRASPAF